MSTLTPETDPSPAPPAATPSAAAAAAAPRPPIAASRWRDSLAWQGILALAALFGLLLIGIFVVMNTYGKRLVVEESRGRVEEAGSRSVEALQRRTYEIAALTRSLAEAAAGLPPDAATVSAVLPRLIDFQGDPAVAGGGYWPEASERGPSASGSGEIAAGTSAPGTPASGGERRSFSWSRDPSGKLVADSAPPPSPGYQQEEWYVAARFLPPGAVAWSESFQDPERHRPVAISSAAVSSAGRFAGAATITLELDSLGALIEAGQRSTGGYGLLLDRHNRIVAFPRAAQAGLAGVESMSALVQRQPAFRPLADAVQNLGAEILRQAKASPRWNASLVDQLDQASDAIDPQEAESLAATIVDPPRSASAETAGRPSRSFDLATDPLTGEPAVVFLFQVPDTGWKLAFVTPRSQLEGTAARISRSLVLLITGVLAAVLLPFYLFLSRRWIQPVTGLAQAAALVRDGDLGLEVRMEGRSELAVLAASFNEMVSRLRGNTESLRRGNLELQRSLAMTDTIMETVHEGLFLLNPELAVEPRHSAALEDILGLRELAGVSFLDLIRHITPEKTHDLTERFLKLLFNPAKNDSVISKINPLKEVEVAFPGAGGHLAQKNLTFNFDRIREGDEIRQAMVTVSDVTSRVQLARQLKESQQRMEHQAEMLLSVMHVEPQWLADFIANAHAELERVNSLLRAGSEEHLSESERHAFYRRLVDQIFRVIHTIKGTAAMLRIDYFTAAAHRFEERLSPLRGRARLDGSDFVPIVLELSEMIDSLIEVRSVIERFGEMMVRPVLASASTAAMLEAMLGRFVGDLAEKSGKKAALSFRAMNGVEIPARYSTPLQNVMAQLVRNSMFHGIESPEARRAAGKPEQGSILVAARQANGRLELLFRDDGQGIDYRRLVERARELAREEPGLLDRLIDREQNQWKPSALDEMIFHAGFSTADEVSVDAGRGFGMSTVREALADLGGRISMRQKPGQFCEFHITLPLAS